MRSSVLRHPAGLLPDELRSVDLSKLTPGSEESQEGLVDGVRAAIGHIGCPLLVVAELDREHLLRLIESECGVLEDRCTEASNTIVGRADALGRDSEEVPVEFPVCVLVVIDRDGPLPIGDALELELALRVRDLRGRSAPGVLYLRGKPVGSQVRSAPELLDFSPPCSCSSNRR